MQRLRLAIIIMTILSSHASAAWYSWPQIWGKDETHPVSATANISRSQQEKLAVLANVLRVEKDFSGMRQAVSNGQAAGFKVLAQLFSNAFPAEEDKQALITGGAEIINYDGNPFYSYGYFCCSQPAWRDYLKDAARSAVETGADGFCLITGNNEDGRCFCSSCEAYFREYLKAKYTAPELAALGIADINTFDYSDYLRGKGYTQNDLYGDNDKSGIPLLEDYKRSNDQTYLSYVQDLINTAKTYGKSDLLVMMSREGPAESTTVKYSSIEAFTFYTDFDVLSNIFSYQENTQAPVYKYEKAMFPSVPIVTQPVDLSMGGIATQTSDPEKYLYGCIAEALANKVSYYDVHDYGLWNNLWLDWSIDPSFNLKIKDFLQAYNAAFDPGTLQSYAKIGVLYSTKTQLTGQWLRPATASASFLGLGKALSKAGFQYDVIFNSTGEHRAETISAGALDPYEIVIIAGTYSLTARERSALLAFANGGGTLIAYGEIDGSLSLTPGETAYGSGRIYYNPASVPKSYAQTAGATYLATIESDVNNYLSGKIIKGITQTHLNRQVWKTADPERVYLHLVNHDVANKVTSLTVSLELPAGFGPDKLYCASPDLAEQELAYTRNGQSITFIVPELDVWDLLILTSTQESGQSAARESIVQSLACGPNPASDSSTIIYSLSEPATIKIGIYSISGNLLKVLSESYTLGGTVRSAVWDLKDAVGDIVPNGVYIYILEARGESGRISRDKGKIIILK
ncbi:MAG: hypothetical protein KKC80_08450 [Candidatus Margulisbacteria bacterium]|nr:hypothetical protein [Candidatus Margulisiibacteriota bacterium]